MKKNKNEKSFERKKQIALLPGHIVLAIWCIFTIALLGWIICASFSTPAEIMSGSVMKFKTGLHFDNYARAWTADSMAVYFKNSLLYAGCAVVGSILISAPAAYALGRFIFKGNTFIKSSFITAMSIPAIMMVMPLFSLTTKLSLTDSKFTLIFLYIGMQIPYTTTFLTSFFANLSSTYEEAAAIDGSTPSYTFWHIMLPLVQPSLITVGIFNFMNVWNDYFLSLVFASSEKNMPVGIGLKNLLASMQYSGDWGGLFASVVIVFMPTLIIFVLFSKFIISGITAGGIKG